MAPVIVRAVRVRVAAAGFAGCDLALACGNTLQLFKTENMQCPLQPPCCLLRTTSDNGESDGEREVV